MKKVARKQTKNVSIEATVPWKYCQDPEMGVWVAYCEPFKLTVQAATYPELLETIGEAINEVFTDLAKTNEVDDFLREHGWQAVGRRSEPRSRTMSFDLPIQTNRVSARDLAEAVC